MRPNSQLDAGGLEGLRALRVVLDAHDFPFPDRDDLEQLGDEALGANALEPLAAQLDEDEPAELEHLAGAQAIRRRPPEERLHDLVRARACLPRVLARGMPGHVVVQVRAQLAVIRAPRKLVDLLDELRVSQRAAAT